MSGQEYFIPVNVEINGYTEMRRVAVAPTGVANKTVIYHDTDSDSLKFKVSTNADNLTIAPSGLITSNSGITVNSTANLRGDVVLGTNSANTVTFNSRVANSGILAASTNYVYTCIPDAAQNSIPAGTGGPISSNNYYTEINTDAGGDAFTLAAGSQPGQLKKIRLVVDGGGNGVVTGTFSGGTTLTFDDAGDEADLMWTGSAWRAICLIGVALT